MKSEWKWQSLRWSVFACGCVPEFPMQLLQSLQNNKDNNNNKNNKNTASWQLASSRCLLFVGATQVPTEPLKWRESKKNNNKKQGFLVTTRNFSFRRARESFGWPWEPFWWPRETPRYFYFTLTCHFKGSVSSHVSHTSTTFTRERLLKKKGRQTAKINGG